MAGYNLLIQLRDRDLATELCVMVINFLVMKNVLTKKWLPKVVQSILNGMWTVPRLNSTPTDTSPRTYP